MWIDIDRAFILYRQILQFKRPPYDGKDKRRQKENNYIHNHADSNFTFI